MEADKGMESKKGGKEPGRGRVERWLVIGEKPGSWLSCTQKHCLHEGAGATPGWLVLPEPPQLSAQATELQQVRMILRKQNNSSESVRKDRPIDKPKLDNE